MQQLSVDLARSPASARKSASVAVPCLKENSNFDASKAVSSRGFFNLSETECHRAVITQPERRIQKFVKERFCLSKT